MISQLGKVLMRKSKSLRRFPQKKNTFDEKSEAAKSKNQRHCAKSFLVRRKRPKATSPNSQAQVQQRASRMIFQIPGEVFQKEFPYCHGGSLPHRTTKKAPRKFLRAFRYRNQTKGYAKSNSSTSALSTPVNATLFSSETAAPSPSCKGVPFNFSCPFPA